MNTLRLCGVGFEYRSDAPLFDDLNAHLTSGWTGLVGANGAGKTTLFRLILGELCPNQGHIQHTPTDPIVAWCPQRVEALPDDVEALSTSWDSDAIRLRDRLRLAPENLWRWETLSPGERKRWQIGGALARDPDVLLLDEPTNHLDRQGRAWLLEALERFPGVGVVISHDRALLDALTHTTLWLEDAHLTTYRTPYSQARDARHADLQARRDVRAGAKRKLARAERQRDAAAQKRAGAERARSMRHVSPKDNDARSMVRKGRIEKATAVHARAEGVARRERDRASDTLQGLHVPKELGRSLRALAEPCPRRVLASLEQATLFVGEVPLLEDVTVTLARDSRVGVTGVNGAGKTTLVRALLQNMPQERLLVLPQVLAAQEVEAMRAELRARPASERGHVMNVVAALGTPPERILSGDAWSPGEARKVALGLGLTRPVWALVLDEPTNHLDLPSIERLEALLAKAYDGALLLISHDDALLERTTKERWHVEGGRVRTL